MYIPERPFILKITSKSLFERVVNPQNIDVTTAYGYGFTS